MEDGCGVISAGLYLQSWRCKVDATCLMCHVCIQSSRPGGPVGTPRVEATDHGAVTRPRRAPAGGVGARAGKLSAYRSPIGADGPDRAVRPPVAASAARSGCVSLRPATYELPIIWQDTHPPCASSTTRHDKLDLVPVGGDSGRGGRPRAKRGTVRIHGSRGDSARGSPREWSSRTTMRMCAP